LKLIFRSFVVTMALVLVGVPLGASVSHAESNQKANTGLRETTEFTIEEDGETINVQTSEQDGKLHTILTDNKGTQEFTTDLNTNETDVESDYLTEEEINQVETDYSNVEIDVEDEVIASEEAGFSINAIKGSWAWSGYRNVTVTANGKASAQVITQAILSAIPKIGVAAGALANVWLQYNLKTGYFKVRDGTALDTDPHYVWRKRTVKLYKEKSRKTLLSTKTSKAWRQYNHVI